MPAAAQPLPSRPAPGGPAVATAAAGAAVAVLLTVAGTIAARPGADPGTAAERDLPPVVLLACLAGLAAGPAAAWAVREAAPEAAVGLAVATAAVALPVWAGWPWLPEGARAATLAAGPFAVAGLAQVALRPRGRGGGRALRATWVTATVSAGLHLLAYDPFADPWCARTCATVPAALDGVVSTPAAVTGSAALVVLGAAMATTAVVTRAAGIPPLLGTAVVLAMAGLGAAAVVRAAGWGGSTAAGLLVVLAPAAPAAVAGAVGAGAVRTARTRRAVDALLQQLGNVPDGAGGGSPRLRGVHFAVPEEHRWVDPAGADVPSPEPASRTVVLPDRDGPAVRLLLAPGTDAGAVTAGLTPARRLALTNARLTAVARARLGDLQTSQRRAVARRDAERTRIERDVHDGAQQRLVSATVHLSLAQVHAAPEQRAALARAQAEVRTALARLRRITRGPFPAVLDDEGLLPALEDLAADADVPVRLAVQGDLRPGADAARAAYAVVALAMSGACGAGGGAAVRVAVSAADGLLRIRAEIRPAPSAEPDATDVADRVGAVGGSYERTRDDGGTTVTAVIPCGS